LANHKSALKRARQNEKRNLRNKVNKTRVKNTIKAARNAAGQSPEQAESALKEAMRVIDKAATKGTLHRKTASRRIARLSREIFKAQRSA
jgi:small subunit ribosomal protein S20